MGNLWTRFKHKDARIILLGLDSAGKTSILYRLKLDDLITTIPTIGFNVETIQYKDMNLTTWDIGSRDKIRPLFRHYYKGADAVVFVIDSHDPERLDELNYDVIKPAINAEELTNAVFLFLANKMDLDDVMSTEEISERLGLRFLKHPWGILPVSAVSGDGLMAALDWLAVRLGSAVVKARNFTQPQPLTLAQAAAGQRSASCSQPSSSSPKPKLDTGRSRSEPSGKPVILVNSKLYDTRGGPSPGSSPSLDRACPSGGCNPGINYMRRSSTNIVNSFSSYSITQSMKEDRARRKLSAISLSRPDVRKMSVMSLNDTSEGRKMSTISLQDSPPREELEQHQQQLRLLQPNSLGQQSHLLSSSFSTSSSSPSPSASKQSHGDLSLSGFGNFSPIMADYIQSSKKDLDSNVKDSDSSMDSVQLTSPSDHIQPHLRALGIKKPSFLSSSGKYVVNPSDSRASPPTPPTQAQHILQNFNNHNHNQNHSSLSNLVSSPDSMSESASENGHNSLQIPGTPPLRPMYLSGKGLNASHDSSFSSVPTTRSGSSCSASQSNEGIPQKQKLSPKTSSDSSQNSSSSAPSPSTTTTNNKRSTLDLFCTPSRKHQQQQQQQQQQNCSTTSSPAPSHHSHHGNDNSMAVVAASSSSSNSRGPASCLRAYSAIRCLFFRPTKREMQEETNSISSDDEDGVNGNLTLGGHCVRQEVTSQAIPVMAGGADRPVML